jgi:hypothetical protein
MPLPAGLALNASTGALVGQPTAAAAVDGAATDYTFTVQGVDSLGQVARKQFTITVNPAVSLTLSYPATGTVGVAYSGTVTVTGGVAPRVYTVATGALPTSLSLNASTGRGDRHAIGEPARSPARSRWFPTWAPKTRQHSAS